MKIIIVAALSWLIATGSLSAQKKKNVVVGDPFAISYEQGKALYDKSQYLEAIPYFEKAAETNTESEDNWYYAGLSYRYTSQPQKAIDAFTKLEKINRDYWAWFYYEKGVAFDELKQFDNAALAYATFIKKFPHDASNTLYHHQAQYKMAAANAQKELSRQETKMIKPVRLSSAINSDYNDYMPALNPNGSKLYFTSVRPGGVKKEESSDKEGDEDIYVIEKSAGQWGAPQLLPEPINSESNEGAACFSADGQLMVYTACGREGGIGNCDLYISTLEGSQWKQPINLGNVVNSTEWDSQPTISYDGNRIIFTSTRPGGYGSEDLYMIERNGFGEWGPAMNLGGAVNTPFSDMSPFLSQDGKTLYFASVGHPGYGSHDMFKTVLENGRWSMPVNLGRPLNTEGKESYFTIGGSGEFGYFASSREGQLDLFEMAIPEEMRPAPTVVVEGIVTNAKTKALVGAYVMVEDLNTSELIAVSKSNSASGKYLVVLPAGKTYSVSANKEGFFFHSERFDVPATSNYQEIKKNIELKPIEKGAKVVLNNIFFETGKATLTSQSRVELEKAIELMNVNPTMIIEVGGHTDNVGDDAMNMKLSHERAKAVREYLVKSGVVAERIQAKGYGESNPIADNENEEGRKSNRRTEFIILEF
jgi:outer membrane protein OmpA-like peptidoglycan-associated protein/Tol biopolymer transport system component